MAFSLAPCLLAVSVCLTVACSKPPTTSGTATESLVSAEGAPHPPAAAPNEAAVPVLVELFSSEGCSSCPPAERVLGELLDHPPLGARVIPLEFHVDYWDYIGHVDRFGSPAFTERQKVYAKQLHAASLYTPQTVIDGQAELVGSRSAALTRAIEDAAKRTHVSVTLSQAGLPADRRSVTIGRLAAGTTRAKIILAEVDRRPTTRIARGENAGTTIQHTWVATRLVDLGDVGPEGGVVTLPALASGRGRGAVAFAVREGDGAVLGSDSIAIE